MCRNYDWPGNVRELENYTERAVVIANGQALPPQVLIPPGRGGRRLRPGGARATDLQALIQNLVHAGIQNIPAEDGALYQRLVGGVERELIQQVLQLCDNVQVKAAARLGINRNTLHKKLTELRLEGPESEAGPGPGNAPGAGNNGEPPAPPAGA